MELSFWAATDVGKEARGQRGQLPRRQEAVAVRRRRRHGRARLGRGRLAPGGARVPQRGRGGTRRHRALRQGRRDRAPAGDPHAHGARRPGGRPGHLPQGPGRAREARHGHHHVGAAHRGRSRVHRARRRQPHLHGARRARSCSSPRTTRWSTSSSGAAASPRKGSTTRPYKAYKNAVTRAVGVYETVQGDTIDFEILPGDQFLLCSDGLHAYLDDERITDLLKGEDITELPKKLVEHANTGGGHDNITGAGGARRRRPRGRRPRTAPRS